MFFNEFRGHPKGVAFAEIFDFVGVNFDLHDPGKGDKEYEYGNGDIDFDMPAVEGRHPGHRSVKKSFLRLG